MQYIYADTNNKKLILEVGADISTASVLRIYYRKPDGSSGYWTASQESTNSISYLLQSADLTVTGVWKVQPYIVMDDEIIRGDIERFEVKENLA